MANQYVPTAETLPIPTYKIDLSLAPDLRYVALAKDFAPKMKTLTHLFDDIVASVTPSKFFQRVIKLLASVVLFRLHSSEETEEIKGIAKASGMPLYLLVALNVILDSLLGCTSGGVMTAPKKENGKLKENAEVEEDEARMLHFRTLDWGMDPLRDVLVVLEFVDGKSKEPDEVLARTVTYAGFVGVLTGVRKNLSLSLNFRPYHSCTNRSIRIHQFCILFGVRPSVASVLRNVIIPPRATAAPLSPPPLSSIARTLSEMVTSPCYLILSSGSETTVLEKDLTHALITTSSEFIVATNCDCNPPSSSPSPDLTATTTNAAGMSMVLEVADERKETVEKRFADVKKRQEKKWREANEGDMEGFKVKVRESTVMGWLQVYPIWNELTHFGCLMDPMRGTIRWIGRGVLGEDEEGEEELEERAENGSAKRGGGWRSV